MLIRGQYSSPRAQPSEFRSSSPLPGKPFLGFPNAEYRIAEGIGVAMRSMAGSLKGVPKNCVKPECRLHFEDSTN